jgi:2-amino-4-hydroxy-6-hydroxymethyldihydropteridine diphosphokinase
LTSPLEIIDGGGFFVNAVCCFQTTLSPKQLLVELQKIEGDLGKGTKPKNASRFIDIDILFYGKEVYQDEKLEIPHPRWKERLFVLVPLAELTPVIHLHNKQWILSDLIHALSQEKEQTVSLLEKNRLVH